MHHYIILQSIFTALKILCAFVFIPHLPPQPLVTIEHFTVSIILLFLECHRVGIIQHVAFSDWHLSFSNMQLNFLHLFSWLDSTFLFSAV